jgi:dihydroorotate dehydrogenase
MYSLIKSLLFSLPPEEAHELIMMAARLSPTLGALTGYPPPTQLSLPVGNVRWTSPVGLAAGLDKNAEALPFMVNQGFGAVECGTITLRPQPGNPLPRLWRYPEELSLRNAMGFPNQGLEQILPRLGGFSSATPLGINIGMNKDSLPAESIAQLLRLFSTMHRSAGYFVVNVSSPNTPGLRAMQERGYLQELFTELNRVRHGKDLYLKIAPDLEEAKVLELTHLAHAMGLTGIIATNTTIMPERGIGGVSGQLLKAKSQRIRSLILREALPLELIGVGGFSRAQDLFDFWELGGKVIQVYTAYVYQGPGLLKHFYAEITRLLRFASIKDLETFFRLSLDERQKILKGFKHGKQ